MASAEAIARIAKILARATSPEPQEAAASVQAAYKRMRRDGVSVRDLLTLPLGDLYQEPLVRLVMVVLENQADLSPPERRRAFERYMALITARFEAGENHETQGPTAEPDPQEKDKDPSGDSGSRPQSERASGNPGAQHSREATIDPARPLKAGESKVWMGATIVASVMVLALLNTKPKDLPQPSAMPAPVGAASGASNEADRSQIFAPTHVVAALQANLRDGPTSKARVRGTLNRGDLLQVSDEQEGFLHVATADGRTGYVATELLTAAADLQRLRSLSAREYAEMRSGERRIQIILAQAEARKVAFTRVLYSLGTRSDSVVTDLQELQASTTFNISTDTPAARWYSLAAGVSMKAGKYEDAYWESLASVEADPSNIEHYVAFVLASYELGLDETVIRVGQFLPYLAPSSTNAWTLYALAVSLQEGADENLAKSAFALAVRLSRSPSNTRKYLQHLGEGARNQQLKTLIYAALADERESPSLFSQVGEWRPAPPSR